MKSRILISVIGVIAALAMISTLAVAETPWWSVDGESANAATKNYQVTFGSKFMQVDFSGKEILPSQNIHVFFENVGGYTSLGFNTTSANNMPSANYVSKLKDGTTLNAYTLLDNVPTTSVRSAYISLLFPEQISGVTRNVTGNVLIKF